MRYGFIGTGNMASAIIRGALKSGAFLPEEMGGYNLHPQKAQALAQQCGMSAYADMQALVENSDVVVLAVKPQVLPAVLPQLKPLCAGKCIASIAAGKSLDYYEAALGAVRMLRVMPNVNAVVSASASAICANSYASVKDLQAVKALFAAVGTVVELPESQFPIFGAVAGASPAFTYMYIDALARAAVRAGMPRGAALQAAASAVMGSAKMILENDAHPRALADTVCSPGGTTIEGVQTLERDGFCGIVGDAIAAVIEKDKRL